MTNSADILLLVSDPLDAEISIRRDLLALQDALRELECAANFHLRAAEADDTQKYLDGGDRPRFSALHYLGHGYKPPDQSDGFLIFEKADGRADALDQTRLSVTLTGAASEFKLAVISACHSESVAASIFAVGAEHVIAIEGEHSVYEAAAVAFCRRFYQSLLTGRSLAEAFNAGQRAIFTDETMRRIGNQATQTEVAKFKLLSRPGADAAQFFLKTEAGQAILETLPSLSQPPFDQHPAAGEFIGRNGDLHEVIENLNRHRAAWRSERADGHRAVGVGGRQSSRSRPVVSGGHRHLSNV